MNQEQHLKASTYELWRLEQMGDIQKTADIFLDGVAEVRVLGIRGKGPWSDFASKSAVGFFDDKEKMAAAIEAVEKEGSATGIYVTLNKINPDISARAYNKLKANVSGAGDEHIEKINWIPIDIDPFRVTGVSSSKEELEIAYVVAKKACRFLEENNIHISVKAMSGNGYHALIAVDFSVDMAPLTHKFLQTLSQMFSTEEAKIDTVNYNPSRIWKAYGTTARKGDSIPTRPHRKAKILSYDHKLVSFDAIESFVHSYYKSPDIYHSVPSGNEFNLKNYLLESGVEITKEKVHGSSTLYCLKNCVFNPEHDNNQSAFGQKADGVIFYQCFHDSCSDKTWHDAKAILGWVGKQKSADVSNYQQMSGTISNSQGNVSKTEQNERVKPIALLVNEYVSQASGIFTTYDIDNELCIKDRRDKNARATELNRLKKQGLIKHEGRKRGAWRIVDGQLKPMDLTKEKPQPLPILLPLGLHNHCEIYPGNIIIVAGSPNSGKSAYVSSLIHVNNSIKVLNSLGADISNSSKSMFEQMAPLMCPGQKRPNVHLFSSEAGEIETAARLKQHDGGLEAFAGVNFWERTSDFADVIDPIGVNVIDYLEVYENFYEIGSWINDIHRELSTGIAIIVLQKKRGAEVGKGGDVTLEKPRLYITLENNAPYGGICKVMKAKFPKDPTRDPNGKEIDYKLYNGCTFEERSDLRFVNKKMRAGLDEDYASTMDKKYQYTQYFKTTEGEVVQLKTKDFSKWQSTFENLDVKKELDKIENQDPWLKKKSWFFQVTGVLKKLNVRQVAI